MLVLSFCSEIFFHASFQIYTKINKNNFFKFIDCFLGQSGTMWPKITNYLLSYFSFINLFWFWISLSLWRSQQERIDSCRVQSESLLVQSPLMYSPLHSSNDILLSLQSILVFLCFSIFYLVQDLKFSRILKRFLNWDFI